MRAIYKYRIEGECWINAPVVHWLEIDWQEREKCYCAWALVDLNEGAKVRRFQFVPIETGQRFSERTLDGYQHIGSVNLNYYVLHWFVGELDPKTGEIMKEDKDEDVIRAGEAAFCFMLNTDLSKEGDYSTEYSYVPINQYE